jgi:hypothetical protein
MNGLDRSFQEAHDANKIIGSGAFSSDFRVCG